MKPLSPVLIPSLDSELYHWTWENLFAEMQKFSLCLCLVNPQADREIFRKNRPRSRTPRGPLLPDQEGRRRSQAP